MSLALRDRAYELIKQRQHVDDSELLAYVYGGQAPAALRSQLLGPLVDDPRLLRAADGSWHLAQQGSSGTTEFTALALATTGPNPERGRIVRVVALHVAGGEVRERFDLTVNPGRHVPGYAAARAGVETSALNDAPELANSIDDLVRFLGELPVAAQEARQAWGFVSAEARRAARTLREPPLVDVNEFAEQVLSLTGKPSLSQVAQHLGVSFARIDMVDEEARVLALTMSRLAVEAEFPLAREAPGVLRSGQTARELADAPGVYVMRDADETAVYVGKARRLRTRVAAYVHRPLGPTRRLEGLASAVRAVDALECPTDLEALVLEDREIRRLRPRFNTQRQLRVPRVWLHLPPQPANPKHAPARIELAATANGACVGPFRNQYVAAHARDLARAVFGLDELRRRDRERYVEQLRPAWAFLNGSTEIALQEVRARHARAVAEGDERAARTWLRRIGEVRDYDLSTLLLPADPKEARYAVVRPGPNGVEGFVLDGCVLVGFAVLEDEDVGAFASQLLSSTEQRTTPEDRDVVLRWLGAQRPSARIVYMQDDAAEAIEDAALAVLGL